MTPEEAIKVLETLDLCGKNHTQIFLKNIDSEAIKDGIEALRKVSYLKKYARPCNACVFSKGATEYDNGCTKWKCVFDE